MERNWQPQSRKFKEQTLRNRVKTGWDFHVLRRNTDAGILVECAFMDNLTEKAHTVERTLMHTDKNVLKKSFSVRVGVYLGLKSSKT